MMTNSRFRVYPTASSQMPDPELSDFLVCEAEFLPQGDFLDEYLPSEELFNEVWLENISDGILFLEACNAAPGSKVYATYKIPLGSLREDDLWFSLYDPRHELLAPLAKLGWRVVAE